MVRKHRKARHTVDGPTVSVQCQCGARLQECWLSERPDGAIEVDGYPLNDRWQDAAPSSAGGISKGMKNIIDEDWFRVVCRCSRDYQGRRIQIAGLVIRASKLGLDSASMEHLPSPFEAEQMGAYYYRSRPNRWRRSGGTEPDSAMPW
jgi:hypothetical protein